MSILTGLSLFSWILDRPPWTTLFGWTWSLMGIQHIRLVHFLLMFAFIAFAVHHVYSAVLVDREERNGELSSIVTGWKLDYASRGGRLLSAGVAVLGLGNVVLTDDGLGVHAVRRLRARHTLGPGVEVVEGGTAGLLLLPWLADSRRAIVVDAIDRGAPPGSLHRLDGAAWTSAFDARMSPHDAGLADLLGAARARRRAARGPRPARPAAGAARLGNELSPPVAAALDRLVDAVAAQLAAWGCAVDVRDDSALREDDEEQQHEERQCEPHDPEDEDGDVAEDPQ